MSTTLAKVLERISDVQATTLPVTAGGTGETWFDTLTDAQKEAYLSEHPDSKYAKDYKPKSDSKEDKKEDKKEVEKKESEPAEKPKKTLKERISSLPKRVSKIFTSGAHEAGSDERKDLADFFRKKKDTFVEGVVDEVKEFKTAAGGVRKLLTGGEIDEHDKEAFKAVTKHLVLTALYMGVGGGLAHGVLVALSHVPSHIATTVIVESLGAAAVASEMSDEEAMGKFVEHFSKMVKEGNIPEEVWIAAAEHSANDSEE